MVYIEKRGRNEKDMYFMIVKFRLYRYLELYDGICFRLMMRMRVMIKVVRYFRVEVDEDVLYGG